MESFYLGMSTAYDNNLYAVRLSFVIEENETLVISTSIKLLTEVEVVRRVQ